MPGIDLYTVYRLDRRQSPEALGTQLAAAFNATDPRDTLTRNRIDTARAILGDPARRARYDAALADPTAPTIDEPALAAIAGRPAPAAPRTGVAQAFATTRARIMAAVVGVLALLLVISVTAIACSSGGGSTPTASNGANASDSEQSSSSDGDGSTCEAVRGRLVTRTKWKDDDDRPRYVLKLDRQIDLPSEVVSEVGAPDRSANAVAQLTQYQDQTVGVGAINLLLTDAPKYVAQYNPEGDLVKLHAISTKSNTAPSTFDKVERTSSGYMRVQAGDGIEIPAASGGTEPGQQFITTALPDAFDKDTVWVLMRGGTKLYRGTVYADAPDSGC